MKITIPWKSNHKNQIPGLTGYCEVQDQSNKVRGKKKATTDNKKLVSSQSLSLYVALLSTKKTAPQT